MAPTTRARAQNRRDMARDTATAARYRATLTVTDDLPDARVPADTCSRQSRAARREARRLLRAAATLTGDAS